MRAVGPLSETLTGPMYYGADRAEIYVATWSAASSRASLLARGAEVEAGRFGIRCRGRILIGTWTRMSCWSY